MGNIGEDVKHTAGLVASDDETLDAQTCILSANINKNRKVTSEHLTVIYHGIKKSMNSFKAPSS